MELYRRLSSMQQFICSIKPINKSVINLMFVLQQNFDERANYMVGKDDALRLNYV